jgi:hypothetical protein
MAGKFKADHSKVIKFAKEHPEMVQAEIAEHFGLTQSQISKILRVSGVSNRYRGRVRRRCNGQTSVEFEWEQRLSRLGLGMERGSRLNNRDLLYGYEPGQGVVTDHSATES